MDTNKQDKQKTDDPVAAGGLSNEGESLEFSAPASGSVIAPAANPASDNNNGTVAVDSNAKPESGSTDAITPGQTVRAKRFPLKALWERLNIYLLLFIFVIALSIAAIAIVFFKNRTSNTTPENSITQQNLSADALEELAVNGIQIGDPKQVLNVQSNSVFSGTVLVKGEMQVAGGLKIGSGSLNIPDMNIGGTALINDLQTQTLSVASNTSIQGQLTVQKSLSVSGGGSFSGPVSTPLLTTARLQLSGDLILSRHIVAGGSIPNRVNGGALGSGGTSSNSGSDTAGTININTGSGASPGCMVTITFAQAFTSTPHISVTPVGPAAAGIDYYITRNLNNFSLCSTSPPPSNQSFAFDYLALD